MNLLLGLENQLFWNSMFQDDLDIGDMSQRFSNSLTVTGKDEATSSYADSLPSNDTVVEYERTEENKKRTEATEVCGVIVRKFYEKTFSKYLTHIKKVFFPDKISS